MIIYKCDICGAELGSLSAFEVEVTPIFGAYVSDVEQFVGTRHVCRYCLAKLGETWNRWKEIEDGQVE